MSNASATTPWIVPRWMRYSDDILKLVLIKAYGGLSGEWDMYIHVHVQGHP